LRGGSWQTDGAQKKEFDLFVGTAATTWCGRGAMPCKAMADNIRSQSLAFTAKRKNVLDELTTCNFSDDRTFDAAVYAWNGGFWTGLFSTASQKGRRFTASARRLEAVYKHCVKDQQIERHFQADIRALARATAAAAFPAGETPQEPAAVNALATGDCPDYVNADVGHADGEVSGRPERL
jgi:hypothetical protein